MKKIFMILTFSFIAFFVNNAFAQNRAMPGFLGSGIYDIRNYGAKVDGVTDDVTAVQSAINAANTDGGGALFFPEGTTLVGSTLTWYGNISGYGTGFGSILKISANDTLIKIIGSESVVNKSVIASTADSSQTDVVVGDGTLFSAGNVVIITESDERIVDHTLGIDSHVEWNEVASVDADTLTMLHELRNTFHIDSSGYVAVLTPKKDIIFENMQFRGVGADSTSNDGFAIVHGNNIIFKDCKFTDLYRSLRIKWSKEISMVDCLFEDVQTGTEVRYSEIVKMRGCKFFNVIQTMALWDHADYCSQIDCYSRNSTYGMYNEYFSDYTTIIGNVYENTLYYGIVNDFGSRHARIIGNHFHNTGYTAITLVGPDTPIDSLSIRTYFIVTGNTIRNAKTGGIAIEACSNNIVSNNSLMYVGSTISHHGILMQSNTGSYCDDNIISNNILYNVTGEAITYTGAGKFRGNITTGNIITDSYRGIFIGDADFTQTVVSGNVLRNISSTAMANLDTTAIGDFTAISDTFDLSGAAATEVVFVPIQNCYILSCVFLYKEATSADAGIALKVGTPADDDRFYSITSHVSQSANTVRRKAGTSFNVAAIAGTPVVVKSAGGKVGTGTVRFILNIANIGK